MGSSFFEASCGVMPNCASDDSEQIRQYQIRGYERIEAKVQEQRAFFSDAANRLVVRTIRLNVMDLLMVNRALTALLKGWKVVQEAAYDEYRPTSVSQQAVQVAPNQYDYVLKDGRHFWQGPEGERMTVDYECDEDRMCPYSEAGFAVPRERYDWLLALLEKMREWMDANHFLRCQSFGADGEFLKLENVPSWDKVLIPDAVRNRLEGECIQLFKHAELFRANGLPLRRGIILHGPPGTGKTLIGRLLAKLCGVTFILITPGMISNPEILRQVFIWGRRFGPSILFFEDFDLVAGNRHENGSSELLGEFLSCLDGVGVSDGIVAIATTNNLNAIEPALRNRPNRFDCILEIPPLSLEHRQQYLLNWLEGHPDSQVSVESVAKKAKNYTGAQMQELCRQAVIMAVEDHLKRIRENPSAIEGSIQKTLPLMDIHFARAFDRTSGKKSRPIGFQKELEG